MRTDDTFYYSTHSTSCSKDMKAWRGLHGGGKAGRICGKPADKLKECWKAISTKAGRETPGTWDEEELYETLVAVIGVGLWMFYICLFFCLWVRTALMLHLSHDTCVFSHVQRARQAFVITSIYSCLCSPTVGTTIIIVTL